MEVDEFTERLMERTKARKDYLTKKMAELRKRTALSDDCQLYEPSRLEEEESPKRQCLKNILKSEESTEEEDSDVEMKEENKENDIIVVGKGLSQARGLAALRKKNTCHDGERIEAVENPRIESKVNSRQCSSRDRQPSAHRSRLVALASHINQLEDDSYTKSKFTNLFPDTHAASSHNSTSNKPNTYKLSTRNSNLNSAVSSVKTVKRVTFDSSCGDGGLSGSESETSNDNFNFEKIKSNLSAKMNWQGNEQQVQKVRVWDRAILATLESQGFVKSASATKISYEFAENKASHNTEISLGSEEDSSDDDTNTRRNEKCTVSITLNPPDKEGDCNQSAIDPTELPISARKAFFEKAFNNVIQKQSGDVIEPKLSVAQRAALFEQGSNFKKPVSKAPNRFVSASSPVKIPGPFPSPAKVVPTSASPEKFVSQSSSPAKCPVPSTSPGKCLMQPTSPGKFVLQCPSPGKFVAPPISPGKFVVPPISPGKFVVPPISPEKFVAPPISPGKLLTPIASPAASPLKSAHVTTENVLSPSKNVSAHTRAVQQQLIEHSSGDWKRNEIVSKISDERKKEISALLNHWEKVSASDNTHPDEIQKKSSTSSESEKYPSVFQERAMDSSTEDESLPNDEESDLESDLGSIESLVHAKRTHASDPLTFDNMSDEAAAVCDEIDEIMNKALNEAADDDGAMMPPPPPPLPAVFKSPKSSVKSNSSSSGGSVSSFTTPTKKPYNSSTPVEQGNKQAACQDMDDGDEVPLLHTVSFYRRQKQEKRATSHRTIVRREQVSSPPSPEVDRMKAIQERIQALQEEVLAQQTVISQTSQALNLCHATEEFSGSTEQVECERLLLIATQKRQACLNEIQRLKMHGGPVKLPEDGTGTLILNDIKLPLKQDFIASQKNGKGSDTVHYFLCLVRHGYQVIVTQMLSAEDEVKNGSLCFTNHITLHELPPDFCVAFEVYALRSKKEVLPHDRKYHIKKEHSKIRLTPKGKKADSKLLSPAVSSPGGPNAVRTSNFSVIGFTRFTLQNCNRQICTLEKVPFTSPLEGVLQVKMQLHAEHNVVEKGFLTMFEDVSGFGAWHRRWCVLNGKNIAFWKYPDDERKKEPILVITLKQCITGQVKLVSRDICARSHTFELVTIRPQAAGDKNTLISRSVNTLTTTRYLLSADTKEERIMWCNRLNSALTNVRKWDPNALHPIEAKQEK